MISNPRAPQGTGIGLRLPHIREIVATRPEAAWLEIHPENFLANPHARELLLQLCGQYRISIHTVGISIGSAGGIDRVHLKRRRNLADSTDPFLVSGHLAWSTFGSEYLNDLLPLPYNKDTLAIVAANIHEVQDTLGWAYLVENPASYAGFRASAMSEPEFLTELVHRTGCRLLCDISNVYVSARNIGFDPYGYLDQLPGDAIRELHLGGYTPEEDPADPAAEILVDTHAAAISDPVWELYLYAVYRFGRKPTLIEWDNDLPPLDVLIAEAKRADNTAAQALPTETRYAGAR